MVAGRLTPEEFEERLGLAYRATTQADLDAIKHDLPSARRACSASWTRAGGGCAAGWCRRRAARRASRWLCVAIWLASGASGSFWPIWVIIFTLLPLARDAWHLLGPAPDHEQVKRASRLATRAGSRAGARARARRTCIHEPAG